MKSRVVGVAIVALGLSACNPQPQKQPAAATSTAAPVASPAPKVPPLKITGQGTAGHPIQIVQQRGNQREYVLLARSYESRTAQGLGHAIFQDAIVTFYEPGGRRLAAQAPQAIVDEASKTVTMAGGVIAHTVGGQGAMRNVTLHCDSLTYNRASGLVHGEGNVRMANTSGMNLTGSRFDSDITLANIRMQ